MRIKNNLVANAARPRLKLTSLICFIIFLFVLSLFLFRSRKQNEWKNREVEDKHQHHHNFPPDGSDALRFLSEWECDYCGKNGKISHLFGVNADTDQELVPDEKNSSLQSIAFGRFHLKECEEAQKYADFLDSKKDNNLTYDDNEALKKKGYGYETVNQISRWGLFNRVNLPDLKEKERKGVAKSLTVVFKRDKEAIIDNIIDERTNDQITFLIPRTTPITSQSLPELLREGQKPDFFYTMSGSKNAVVHEKIITSFFIWRVLKEQRSWNYNIYVLENNEDNLVGRYLPVSGNSAAVVWYLSLLSAYHQKPISREVAATGAIEIGRLPKFQCVHCFQENELSKNMEENFSQNQITSVGALALKSKSAVESGAKKLILSTEQKEDYEKNVPEEIKEKLKVYYVKDVEELEKLFWEGEFS
jgi:hypothetical protein